MKDRVEEIFQQVMDEVCKDPLRRFAELIRQDERKVRKRKWVGLNDKDFQYQQPNEIITMKYTEAILKEKNT